MIYWTTYNFTGYMLYKANIIPMNEVLKTSFICTSLIGGYMVYIYPRKLIVRYGDNQKYSVPYSVMIIGDFITHQLPLIDCFNIPNKLTICGGYLFPLMFSWYSMNKVIVKDTKRIYGIELEKLLLSTLGIFSVLGIIHHLPKLIKN